MDPATLATGLARFLTPFLPYLLRLGGQAGEAVARAAGERFGGRLWSRVEALWSRLRPAVEDEPGVRAAAEEAARAVEAEPPEDPERVAAAGARRLAGPLERLLAADPALARDLAELLRAARAVEASGEGAVAVGEMRGGTVVTGEGNVVQTGGKYNVNVGRAGDVTIGDRDDDG